MGNCLFCDIARGRIDSVRIYEDQHIYAFNDINPTAPVHVLIIPKRHITSANDFLNGGSAIVSEIFEIAAKIAKKLGIDGSGYRIVTNCGEHGGQTVEHLHFHLIGGRALQWPPG